MTKVSLVVVAVLAAAPLSANLLVNGDFESPLETGWTQAVNNAAGAGAFEWADTLGQPVPGHAARVRKDLAYFASLSQTVDVPGANLELRLDGRLRIGGGSSTCWPVAAVFLRYRDAAGASLGNSCIYLRNQYCTWASSDTQHLVDITTPDVWTLYTLDVRSELTQHLTGINPAAVAKVTVDLFAYDNGT